MKKKVYTCVTLLLIVFCGLTGCKNYDDDIRDLNERVDRLETEVASLQETCLSIDELIVLLSKQLDDLEAKDNDIALKLQKLQREADSLKILDFLPASEAASTYALVGELAALQVLIGDIAAVIQPNTEAADLSGYIHNQLNDLKGRLVNHVASLLPARVRTLIYLPENAIGRALVGNQLADEVGFRLAEGTVTLQFEVRTGDNAGSLKLADTLAAYPALLALEAINPATGMVEALTLSEVTAEAGVLTVTADAGGLVKPIASGQGPHVSLAVNDGSKTGNYVRSAYVPLALRNPGIPGLGTVAQPFVLERAIQLETIRTYIRDDKAIDGQSVAEMSFCLAADIDMSEYPDYTGLGAGVIGRSYKATFDGRGHTITMGYNGAENFVGAAVGFGEGCTVKNVNVAGSIATTGSNIGGVAGCVKGGRVTGCSNEAAIVTGTYAGGVVGVAYQTMLDLLVNRGSVTGTTGYIGGVVGWITNCTVRNCGNTADVTGSYYVGGVLGEANQGENILTNCYNWGKVKGTDNGTYRGGIVGTAYKEMFEISACYSTGAVVDVNDTKQARGSIFGNITSTATVTLSDSYWDSSMVTTTTAEGATNAGINCSTCGSYGTTLNNANTVVAALNAVRGENTVAWVVKQVGNKYYPILDIEF